MAETPWEIRQQGALLLVDHIADPDDFHQWVFLPGYKDAPVTVRRDWLGRGISERVMGEPWVLLICNNSDCPARAAFRARVMEDGATEPGAENAYPSTPGEFAARWNSWSDERRAGWLTTRISADERSMRCFVGDHDGEIAVLRRELDRLTSAFALDAQHLDRQRTFSQMTFGPGERLAGVLDHIRKEIAEVEAAPGDESEWADLVILAFDGALRQGIEPQAILDAILAKQTKNESREWPDWRTADPNKAIEHVR